MMRNVAVIVDGVWQPVEDQPRALIGSGEKIDQITALLGQVVLLAQSLFEPDRRRARDFVHATQSALSATTYLPASDQKVFDAAIRNARTT